MIVFMELAALDELRTAHSEATAATAKLVGTMRATADTLDGIGDGDDDPACRLATHIRAVADTVDPGRTVAPAELPDLG